MSVSYHYDYKLELARVSPSWDIGNWHGRELGHELDIRLILIHLTFE